MIERIDFDQPNIVGYKMREELTKEDVERIHNDLRAAISAHDNVHLYTDATNLEGVEPKAVIEDLKMTPEYIGDIDRYAVVGDERWQEWFTRAGDAITKGEARYFAPDEAAIARNWISGTERRTDTGRRPGAR